MSDSANMFKKLAQNRQKSTPAKPESEIGSEIKSVPEPKPPKKTKSKAQAKTPAKKTAPKPTSEEKPTEIAIAEEPTTSAKKPTLISRMN